MSDVSKIIIEGVTLNIKDSVARQGVNEVKRAVNEVSNLLNNTYLFIGDSYGAHLDTEKNWCEYCAEYMGLETNQWYQRCNSGAGFTIISNSFLSLLKSLENNVTDKTSITHIVVCGGMNDNNSSSADIMYAIKQFVDYSKSVFPNANVYIGYIGWSLQPTEKIANTIKVYTQCSELGAYYLNNIEYSLHLPKYLLNRSSTDVHHPSEQGEQAIARNLMNCLHNGSCDVTYIANQFVDTTASTNIPLVFKGRVRGFLHNGMTQIAIGDTLLGYAGAFAFKGTVETLKEGSAFVICDLADDIPAFGCNLYQTQVIVPFRIYSLNNMLGFGSIGVKNRQLIFQVIMIPNEVSTNVTITIPAVNLVGSTLSI